MIKKKNPTTFSFSGVFPMIRGIRVCVGDRLGLSLQPGYFSNEFPMSNVFQEVLKPLQSAVSSLAASCPFLSGNTGQMGIFHRPPMPPYKWASRAPVTGTAGCC